MAKTTTDTSVSTKQLLELATRLSIVESAIEADQSNKAEVS